MISKNKKQVLRPLTGKEWEVLYLIRYVQNSISKRRYVQLTFGEMNDSILVYHKILKITIKYQ